MTVCQHVSVISVEYVTLCASKL